MSELQFAKVEGLPTNEAEVIARLKNPPVSIKLVATRKGDQDARHWVELTYDFEAKLKSFGSFFVNIAEDIDQAGGVVTKFDLGTGLSPDIVTLDPKGQWRAMHVHVSFKTKVGVANERAWWDAAFNELFNKRK